MAIREVWAYHSSTGTALLFKLAECKFLSLSLKLYPLTPNVPGHTYLIIHRFAEFSMGSGVFWNNVGCF